MRKTNCNICDKTEISLNETIKIDGQIYCSDCFETNFPDQGKLENKLVEREIDPTICFSCRKDFGEQELAKISTYPICNECEIIIKNRTFPTWVKGFFIGIVVIVIFSFIWNWKYYSAYNNIKKSNEYAEKRDYLNASLLMKSASEKVPEVEDLKILSNYTHGIELLSKDKCKEALAEFENCKEKVPPSYNINALIVQAKIGVAFDNKDYNGFLNSTLENYEFDTSISVSCASVASAYACLYADNGKEEYKQNSIKYLDKAKQIDSTSQEMKSYYNMIEYRIDSRKIIKSEEFIKQFPNGWIKN